MTTAVQVQTTSAPGFSADQIALIKRTFASDNLTEAEFQLFCYTAHRLGLDPLARQVYVVKRTSRTGPAKIAVQTSIDGYRLIADRTGKYAGNDDPIYDTEEATNPQKATVTVYKIVDGVRCGFQGTARWREYAPDVSQPAGFMWRKMPYLMLGKVAEALALRKAFPAELSGVYTDAEMDQADDRNGQAPKARGPQGAEPKAPPTPAAPAPTGGPLTVKAAGAGRWVIDGDPKDTYAQRERIKALGFQFDKGGKVWWTDSAEKAEDARQVFEEPVEQGNGSDETPPWEPS